TSKRVEELELRRAKAADQVESPISDLRVLVQAVRPSAPERSLRKLIALAAPLFAGVVALVVLLARALWGLRVQSPNEAAYWSGLPVVASSTWPLERRRLVALVDEIAAGLGPSKGSTVVLGLSEHEV